MSLTLALFITNSVLAHGYNDAGPFDDPHPAGAIPPAIRVPAKVYSDNPDRDENAQLAHGRMVAWDGYGGTRNVGSTPGQTDAIAAAADTLFNAVGVDNSHLLFSVETSPNIYLEPWQQRNSGLWATPPMINEHGVYDVDALQVWGEDAIFPDGPDIMPFHAGFFSQADVNPGSIYGWRNGSVVQVYHAAQLAQQIAQLRGLTSDQQDYLAQNLDVDALMAQALTPGADPKIIFSLAPVDFHDLDPCDDIDGGEIFTWAGVGFNAGYLLHGSHLWDTKFEVMNEYGLESENVNALETVSIIPEPFTIAALAVGTAAIIRRRRRRRT